MPPTAIVERYTARWQIEVCFRDLEQHLGFGARPARSRHAVERVTPFAAYVYSLTVLWARTALRRVDRVPRIKRPWYRDKTGLASPTSTSRGATYWIEAGAVAERKSQRARVIQAWRGRREGERRV